MVSGLKVAIALPDGPIPAEYFGCRYTTLREPLGFSEGAERLADDPQAIHAWWQTSAGDVVAVGRVHLIPEIVAGFRAGPGAENGPHFASLTDSGGTSRPAVQIRQMGTRSQWRRRGLAAGLLGALEENAIRHWGARSGWLEARLPAIVFYEDQGWAEIGEEYEVKGIGAHRSMWKRLASDVGREVLKGGPPGPA